MDIKIIPNHLSGVVKVPQSKSICHRALICAAFADKPVRMNISDPSYDVLSTIEFLRTLGADINVCEGYVDIVPITQLPEKFTFDCGKSSNTLRFAIPFTASLGIEAEFKGDGNMYVNHICSLIELLCKHGCTFDGNDLPLKMSGKIKNGEYRITASESSQFSSSLIMALSRTAGDSRVILLPPINSKRYIDLTISVLSDFGAFIENINDGYLIHGRPFTSPKEYTPELDYSFASVWLSAGVAVKGISQYSKQADQTVIDVLVSMGALIFERDGELHCDINNLHSFSFHGAQFPDIVCSLCSIAATAKGTTHIMGVEKLKYRESDRLHGICEIINSLGGTAYSFDDDIVIKGVSQLKGGEVQCNGDYRLILAAAILSCKCTEPVIIRNADAVERFYRNFWNDFTSVGGIITNI